MARRRDPHIRMPQEQPEEITKRALAQHARFHIAAADAEGIEPSGPIGEQVRADMETWTKHERPERAKPVQHERQGQTALAKAVARMWWGQWWWHVGNERWSQREAHEMARAGVRRGVPDNWLVLPRIVGRQPVRAVAELKGPDGHLSTEQRTRLVVLSLAGFHVAVHRDWEAQFAWFDELAGPNPGRDALRAVLELRNIHLVTHGLLPRTRGAWEWDDD